MALIDDILNPICATLEANLSWLTTAYGKVQRLPEVRDGRTQHYPGLFVGNDDTTNRYIDLRPDGNKGNYCFWEIVDDQEFFITNGIARAKFRFKLIFWFDWRTLYPSDWRGRSIEEVKSEILGVLSVAQYTNVIQVFTVHENADRVYSSYDMDEVHEQFMMREYGGLAIEGEIFGQSGCSLSMVSPTIPSNLYGLIPFNYSSTEQVYPLATWYGVRIYCRTFSLGTGADTYEPLTGLTTAAVALILPFSVHTGKYTASGKPFTKPIEFSHDSGTYEVFTEDGSEGNFITVYYTKV